MTALSVRLAGLERELREAHDVIRHLRVELAARDAEVAALEATKSEMESVLESASSRAERDALSTVLAQSRLVAVLDKQRLSNESLTSNLRNELDVMRDAYKKSQDELLDWKTRALRAESGNGASIGFDESSYRAVATSELEGYIQEKVGSKDDVPMIVPMALPDKRKLIAPPPPINLYEVIERDLKRTQQRLEQLQMAARRESFLQHAHLPPRRSNTYTSRISSSLHPPSILRSKSSTSSPLSINYQSRMPKSEGLRRWFKDNAGMLPGTAGQ